MVVSHEGEILLKETYGARDRFYVKPPGQQNVVVVLDESREKNWYGSLERVFLPQGYPDSVSKDYMAYQIWDTAQAFCSTITGILATQEVFRGVGVGDIHATALAATVTWVIKDGCGHIGRILFAYTHGTELDAYSKKWRLYADVLNDAAMCIEVALPLFRDYTTLALCISTTMRAIVGVAGGATRVAMTQHHALRGNMADVAAKDAAQETAVNFVASIAALAILTVFGNSVSLFMFIMVLHIVFNYFAVRAICLRTLNEPRYLQVISAYLSYEVIASPCEVNRNEPVVFYKWGPNFLDVMLSGFSIKVGCSIKQITEDIPNFAQLLNDVKGAYKERNYLLYPCIANRDMFVMLREEATADEILCAYFHAVLFSIIVCAINSEELSIYQKKDTIVPPFARVCRTIQAADWSRNPTEKIGVSCFMYEPSSDLTVYVDQMVQTEWKRFKMGLEHTGWDISKHLLMADEWRISRHTIDPTEIKLSKEEKEITIPDPSNLKVEKTTEKSEKKLIETEQIDNKNFIIEPKAGEKLSVVRITSKDQIVEIKNPKNIVGSSDANKTKDEQKPKVGSSDANKTKDEQKPKVGSSDANKTKDEQKPKVDSSDANKTKDEQKPKVDSSDANKTKGEQNPKVGTSDANKTNDEQKPTTTQGTSKSILKEVAQTPGKQNVEQGPNRQLGTNPTKNDVKEELNKKKT